MKKNPIVHEKLNQTLARFVEKYPLTFFPKDSQETVPIARGIFRPLLVDNPDIERAILSIFLRVYTRKDRYLRALCEKPHRIGLDGMPCEDVSEEHREVALEKIKHRSVSRASRNQENKNAA